MCLKTNPKIVNIFTENDQKASVSQYFMGNENIYVEMLLQCFENPHLKTETLLKNNNYQLHEFH